MMGDHEAWITQWRWYWLDKLRGNGVNMSEALLWMNQEGSGYY